MTTLRIMHAAFVQHWLLTARRGEFAFNALNQLATIAVIGWLANQSGRPQLVTALAFGIVFMVVWRAAVFQVGGMVNNANNQGTLELEMMARAPIGLVMLGKTLAAIAFYGVIGIAGFVMVLAIGGSLPKVANLLVLLPSLAVAFAAVLATAFLFAPLTFVVGGRGGFFNAIIPVGIVLGGFVQPTGLLPLAAEIPARFLATSWAMDALNGAIRGDPFSEVALQWTAALALSAATFAAAAWLFTRAERRIRRVGAV